MHHFLIQNLNEAIGAETELLKELDEFKSLTEWTSNKHFFKDPCTCKVF